MQIITLETRIAAPQERCFLLSLSIDLHLQSTAPTRERAIAGVTHGLIGPGESVTWQGRHFGMMLIHQSRITQYQRPEHFQDIMVEGVFKSFVHDHYFSQAAMGHTLMRDELRFAAPFGPLGRLAESFVLRNYFTRFLRERNATVQRVAESPENTWQRFLGQA